MENGAEAGCNPGKALCHCWGFVSNSSELCQGTTSPLLRRELKGKADFLTSVFIPLCSGALGSLKFVFASAWHPLVSEGSRGGWHCSVTRAELPSLRSFFWHWITAWSCPGPLGLVWGLGKIPEPSKFWSLLRAWHSLLDRVKSQPKPVKVQISVPGVFLAGFRDLS